MTETPTVTVVGSGIAAAEPDTVTVAFGVSVTSTTPAGALDSAADALARLRGAVITTGVQEHRVQTSGVSVHPDWEHTHSGRRFAGYVASVGLTVSVDVVDRLGRVLDAAVAAGGDAVRVGGLQWEVADRGGAEASARTAAFDDARTRAEHYAQMAGRSLGSVVCVDERTDFGAPRRRAARYFAAAASRDVDVDPGEVEITSSVTVTWELD